MPQMSLYPRQSTQAGRLSCRLAGRAGAGHPVPVGVAAAAPPPERPPGGRVAPMYARSTTIHGTPGSVDAATAYVRDEVMPTVRAMEGCVGLSMLADHDTGHCIVTTSWRDEAAMRSSAEGV